MGLPSRFLGMGRLWCVDSVWEKVWVRIVLGFGNIYWSVFGRGVYIQVIEVYELNYLLFITKTKKTT